MYYVISKRSPNVCHILLNLLENNVTADETVYYRPIAASYLELGAYNFLGLGVDFVVLKSSIVLAKMKNNSGSSFFAGRIIF